MATRIGKNNLYQHLNARLSALLRLKHNLFDTFILHNLFHTFILLMFFLYPALKLTANTKVQGTPKPTL